MAKVIMVQGTTSSAGKSLTTAALCRILKQDGYKVAPFKSQNMSLNSYITKDGLEMGRAQVMQAEACGIEPDVRMNPILLKPTGDRGSQVILNGEVVSHMSGTEYYRQKENLISPIMAAYESLATEYDVIVIEGAGSPAEINLRDRDIVNMGLAELVDAPVILVGDIDRGGVFASLVGTITLFSEEEKARVKGFVINKFRGEVALLQDGLTMLEDRMKIPVLGVIPYMDIEIDDEDGASDKLEKQRSHAPIQITVIKLPRLSNFTDFSIFELFGGVSVNYVTKIEDLEKGDLIIIPGTKNTIEDLKWMRQNGIEGSILRQAKAGKPIFGVCGGYQMLGEMIYDPENVESGEQIRGMGLLKVQTTFYENKTRTQAKGRFSKIVGTYSCLSEVELEGYEIHMGQTENNGEAALLNINGHLDGAVNGNVAGSYVHGIFDYGNIARGIVGMLMDQKGYSKDMLQEFDLKELKQREYDYLADTVRKSLNMDKIYEILKIESCVSGNTKM